MPRPQKRGLDYFPLDTDFFSDNKIRILKARYGVNGIMVYIYLLCEIYKNGYYLTWDSDQKYIMADELNLTDGFIEQVLAFLLERSLLESKLFLSDTVLTSPGIQRRFQLAVKERAKKTPVKVEGFWLLDEETTEPFIQVQLQAGNSVKNEDISRKNVDSSQEKSLKESKEKKSKGEESIEKNSTGVGARVDCRRIVEIFNSVCKSLPKVKSLTDPRKKAIQRAAQEIEKAGGFTVLFEKVEASDFLAGRSGAWCAGFDWILKPANLSKILEGNYDNRAGRKKAATSIDDSSLDLDEYEKAVQDFVPVFGKKDAT